MIVVHPASSFRRMEETSSLADRSSGSSSGNRYAGQFQFGGDDECSIDSGCSSSGSTGSGDRLHGRGRFSKSHHYADEAPRRRSVSTSSQDQLSPMVSASAERRVRARSSESWKPRDSNVLAEETNTRSTNASGARDSGNEAAKKSTKKAILCRIFENLKISKKENQEKHTKKSPKRILRTPVTYTYVKGISGLPVVRVPRSSAHRLALHYPYESHIRYFEYS